MKKITKSTILKQGNKPYNAVEIDGVIFWVDKIEIKVNTWYENNGVLFISDSIYNEGNNPNNSNPKVTDFNKKIIAQSTNRLDGVPVIDFSDFVNENGYE